MGGGEQEGRQLLLRLCALPSRAEPAPCKWVGEVEMSEALSTAQEDRPGTLWVRGGTGGAQGGSC